MKCNTNVTQPIIPFTKHATEHLGRILIIGLGKSGKAAADYCAPLLGKRVESVTVYAGPSSDASYAFSKNHLLGSDSFIFDTEEIQGEYDLCIASPGISQFGKFYQNAARCSKEVVSEVEFAWRESASDSIWVAITGTNGKTTTTSLITHLLTEAGLNAQSVGNIGLVALEAVSQHPSDIYVLEASSFQLASTKYFAPQIAVMLNITPDHLYWHETMDEYIAAKYKVFANMASLDGAVAILDATNDIVREKVRAFKALTFEERGFSYIPIGTASGMGESMIERCGADNAAYLNGDVLTIEFDSVAHELIDSHELRIAGPHNVNNALAAASAAVALGVSDESISAALKTFAPLEHRIEPCGEKDGVYFFNDSKATNVDSTLIALASFEAKSIVLLLGGRDKGTDLEALVRLCHQRVGLAICFGEARARFLEAFALLKSEAPVDFEVVEQDTMAHALSYAQTHAKPGQNVLLSPACASFDEFSGFEQRGDVFKDLVKQWCTHG